MNSRNSISFTIIIGFIVVSIIGLALTPLLNVRLYPVKTVPKITVTYYVKGANSIVIDNDVTTKLEGGLSRIAGVKKISSVTFSGGGRITLFLDKKLDVDNARFQVSTLIRQIYPSLSIAVSYPSINVNQPDDSENIETLISYTLIGSDNILGADNVVKEIISPRLSDVEGVNSVNIYGVNSNRINLLYNNELLLSIGLSINEIQNQIQDYYIKSNLGYSYNGIRQEMQTLTPIIFTGYKDNWFNADEIKISHDNRLFRLLDLVEIEEIKDNPERYYRINGKNAINIDVKSVKGINQIVVASKVKGKVDEIKKLIPNNYNLIETYDSSLQLKSEILKIIIRTFLSLLLLIVFILAISKSISMSIVVVVSLVVNILVSCVVFYLCKVEINLYSISGITISTGIICDNVIVMTNNIQQNNNISIIRAIVAATLTTLGALSIIFFLNEEAQLRLIDFTFVIIISLLVSIVTSLFFVPALMSYFKVNEKQNIYKYRHKKRLVKWISIYAHLIVRMIKFRWIIILVFLLTFGLPVYKLPAYIPGDTWSIRFYNYTFGSSIYQGKIKPILDVAMGGTLRLFSENTTKYHLSSSIDRTLLNISANMHYGSTLAQTNKVLIELEKFLTKYEEIEQFITSINSPSSASIQIFFKPQYEHSNIPHIIKAEIESKVMELGAASWNINGLGKGFDNSVIDKINSRVKLYGYNLEKLKLYAKQVKDYLGTIPRVDEGSISINGKNKIKYREYSLNLDTKLSEYNGSSKKNLLSELGRLNTNELLIIPIFKNGDIKNVYLKKSTSIIPDFWMLKNSLIEIDANKFSRLGQFGSFSKAQEQEVIQKENMEYTLNVEFNFIGSPNQKLYILEQLEQQLLIDLPVGYRFSYMNFYKGKWLDQDNNRLLSVLLIVCIIYIICAIVFESIIQPLVVIIMIPISFIGVFITFYLFDIVFGQGGYASLLLVSGLTVNSTLYIINDLNIYRYSNSLSPLRTYLKAFRNKIVPVVLTLLSTIFSIAPFLYGDKKDSFWFSLSAGVIGGLIFSLFALVVITPLLIRGIKPNKFVDK